MLKLQKSPFFGAQRSLNPRLLTHLPSAVRPCLLSFQRSGASLLLPTPTSRRAVQVHSCMYFNVSVDSNNRDPSDNRTVPQVHVPVPQLEGHSLVFKGMPSGQVLFTFVMGTSEGTTIDAHPTLPNPPPSTPPPPQEGGPSTSPSPPSATPAPPAAPPAPPTTPPVASSTPPPPPPPAPCAPPHADAKEAGDVLAKKEHACVEHAEVEHAQQAYADMATAAAALNDALLAATVAAAEAAAEIEAAAEASIQPRSAFDAALVDLVNQQMEDMQLMVPVDRWEQRKEIYHLLTKQALQRLAEDAGWAATRLPAKHGSAQPVTVADALSNTAWLQHTARSEDGFDDLVGLMQSHGICTPRQLRRYGALVPDDMQLTAADVQLMDMACLASRASLQGVPLQLQYSRMLSNEPLACDLIAIIGEHQLLTAYAPGQDRDSSLNTALLSLLALISSVPDSAVAAVLGGCSREQACTLVKQALEQLADDDRQREEEEEEEEEEGYADEEEDEGGEDVFVHTLHGYDFQWDDGHTAACCCGVQDAGVAALPLTIFRAATMHANLLAYFTEGHLVMRVCECPTRSAMMVVSLSDPTVHPAAAFHWFSFGNEGPMP